MLGWNRDADVHVVRHQVPFQNLTLFLLRQRMENRTQLAADLAENHLPPAFGDEHHVILAVPFGMG
jgi:hypothetical protein